MPVLGKEKLVHAPVINSPYNIRGTVLTKSPRMMPLDATPLALDASSVLGYSRHPGRKNLISSDDILNTADKLS